MSFFKLIKKKYISEKCFDDLIFALTPEDE